MRCSAVFMLLCLGLASASPVKVDLIKGPVVVPGKSLEEQQTFLCDTCLKVTHLIYDRVASNQTEALIRLMLERACEVTQVNRTAECKQFVDQHIDELFAMIRAELSPERICTRLGLCTGYLSKRDEELMKLDNEIAKLDQRFEKTVSDIKKFTEYVATIEMIDDVGGFDSTVECFICDSVVEASVEISSYSVDDIRPRYKVYTDVLDVCELLKGSMREKCSSLVYRYIDDILDALEQGEKPSSICPGIGSCVDDAMLYKPYYYPEIPEEGRHKKNTFYKNIKEDIRESERLVKDIGEPERLIENIQKQIKPSKIPVDELNKEAMGDVPCTICQWAVTEIDNWIKESKTEDEIKAELTRACQLLPAGTKDQCVTFVEQYASIIIEMLVNEGLEPNQVCDKLGLCKTRNYAEEVTATEDQCYVPNIQTEKDFDLESYMGIWYKLSSYDLSIEPAKPDIERMLLTLQDDGTVLIEDPGLREENGQCSQLPFIGRARPLENNNAVWQVKLPDEPSRIIRVVSTNYIDFSIVHTCAHVTPGNVCPEDQIVIDYYSRSSTELASDRISYETMQYILSDACFDPYFDGMEYRNILKEPCSENTWRPVVNEVDFPPVANTGPKRVVAISRSYVLLDGSQSSDDNEIVSYEWAKDVGGSADMEGIRTNKLRVYNLEKDVYVFTLTVTDNAGQVDRSQVTVSVESESKRKSPKDKSLYKLDRPKIDDKTPVKTEKCDMCKMAVQELDTLLESNKDAIKNFVESMCDRIPDPHGSQCHQEVEENFDMIIEMLESTILKPDTLCTSIGFCQTTTVEDIMNEYAVY